MKKLLIAAAAVVALSAPAVAADMAPRYVKAPAPAPVVYNWTGCYIGGNIGGGWERTRQTRTGQQTAAGVFTALPADFGSSDGSDFVGGGQIGCDYQFANNWVIGIQGMYDYARIDSTHVIPAFFPLFNSNVRVKDMYTVTGRLGYLFTPQLLGYVKGGGAWTSVDYVINGTFPVAFNAENAFGVNRSGWTVGGGLEWMFAPGWSVFGEFNYMDFGTKTSVYAIGRDAVPGPFGTDVVSSKLEVTQFLAGVNYKFNFGGPVVAKY
ncbi:outer membrane beta-barrel protein [Bradyrhizobium sp. LjRoot220]|uniref:outer membrane protein n=1 Tax=Bradyrhizobium sp. LjRoot220 TaxID=3342284 RepID=UPI003ECCABE9